MTTNQKKQKKTSKLIKLDKITKRSDYLRAYKSKYVRTTSFVIQFYNVTQLKEIKQKEE